MTIHALAQHQIVLPVGKSISLLFLALFWSKLSGKSCKCYYFCLTWQRSHVLSDCNPLIYCIVVWSRPSRVFMSHWQHFRYGASYLPDVVNLLFISQFLLEFFALPLWLSGLQYLNNLVIYLF